MFIVAGGNPRLPPLSDSPELYFTSLSAGFSRFSLIFIQWFFFSLFLDLSVLGFLWKHQLQNKLIKV